MEIVTLSIGGSSLTALGMFAAGGACVGLVMSSQSVRNLSGGDGGSSYFAKILRRSASCSEQQLVLRPDILSICPEEDLWQFFTSENIGESKYQDLLKKIVTKNPMRSAWRFFTSNQEMIASFQRLEKFTVRNPDNVYWEHWYKNADFKQLLKQIKSDSVKDPSDNAWFFFCKPEAETHSLPQDEPANPELTQESLVTLYGNFHVLSAVVASYGERLDEHEGRLNTVFEILSGIASYLADEENRIDIICCIVFVIAFRILIL